MLQLQARRCLVTLHNLLHRLFLTLPSGHQTSDCKANRVFDTSRVADMSAEDAWDALQKADEDRDLDDFREVRAGKRCSYTQVTDFVIRLFKSTPKPLRTLRTMSSRRPFA